MWFRNVGVLVSLALVSVSCSESSIVGEDLFGEAAFQVSYIDTVTIDLSTVRFDSLATSHNNRLLIGNTSNELFGDVQAETLFLITYTSNASTEVDDNTSFDSATFILPQDGYLYLMEEEEELQTLKIEQLNEEFAFRSDGFLYNYSQLSGSLDGELLILGIKQVKLIKDKVKEFEVRMNDAFGLDLFEKLQSADELVSSQNSLEKYLNGFRLTFEGVGESPFTGFVKDSIRLRIYYTDHDNVPATSESLDFYIGDAPHYTHLVNENVPGALAELKSLEDEVLSSQTQDVSIVGGGTGYVAKVSFPYIRELLLDGKDYLIASSELRLKPNIDLIGDGEDLPDQLAAIYVDPTNQRLSDETFYAELHLDDEYGRDTYYSMDVSDFIDLLLVPYANNDYSILFSLVGEDFESSMTTLGIGSGSLGSELVIYTISNK